MHDPTKRGRGRPAGSPNRVTGELKEMILTALSDAGGVDYLCRQAHENPTAFLALLGRTLPRNVAFKADSASLDALICEARELTFSHKGAAGGKRLDS